MNRCSTCEAPIRWVLSAKGRRLPIDPEPVATGNLFLQQTDEGVTYATVVAPGSRPRLFVSHFATCPQAAAHRSGKRARKEAAGAL